MSKMHRKADTAAKGLRRAASEIRGDFADTLNRVAFGGERVLIHRHGKDLAALVSVEDLELLRRLEDEVDLKKAKAALAEDPEGTSWAKVRKQLGL